MYVCNTKIFIIFYFQLFEKKNQKSAQSIAQLQKKLEEYQKKLRDLVTISVINFIRGTQIKC